MTNREINRAVAESVGWIRREPDCWVHPQHGYLGGDNLGCCPDYCNDLNAMHEIEKAFMSSGKANDYVGELDTLVNSGVFDTLYNTITAPARQRAEAYLRTIGKWMDA